MPTDWRERLSILPHLDDPERIWRRVEQGPTGEEVPTTPDRGQRVVAAVVAIAVFAAAAVFAFGAVREDPTPLGDAPPSEGALVATLEAPDDGSIPFMELRYGSESTSIHPQGGEWPGGPDAWTAELQSAPAELPLGTPFAFVGDATEVEATIRYGLPGDMPTGPLGDVLPDVPGAYVVEVLATWPRGTAAFAFSVVIRDPDAVSITWNESGDDAPWVHARYRDEDVELNTMAGEGNMVGIVEEGMAELTVPAGTDVWVSGEATSLGAALSSGRQTTPFEEVASLLPAVVWRDLEPGRHTVGVQLETAQGPSTSLLLLDVRETATASPQPVAPEEVRVPNVVGLPEAEAVSILAAAGLESFPWYTWVDGVPAGTVASSSPAEGTTVSGGTSVELTVAASGQRPGDGGLVFIGRFQREHPGVLLGGHLGADGFPVAVFEPGQDPKVWVDELDAMISYPRFATAICPVSTEQLEQVVDELLHRSDKGLLESEGHAFGVDPATCSVHLEGDFPPVTVAGLQTEFGDLITIVDGIGPFRTVSG